MRITVASCTATAAILPAAKVRVRHTMSMTPETAFRPAKGAIMRAIRFAVVWILLGAMAPYGYSQVLPRRRAERVLNDILEKTADAMARAIADKLKEMVKDLVDEAGNFFDLQLSTQVFAQMQMDPQMKKRIEGAADRDARAMLAKELIDRGGASVFLAETAKFADKLKKEKFSTPVLEKMYLEYETDGVQLKWDGGEKADNGFTSRQIFMGDFLAKKELPKEPGDRRAVTVLEKQRPRDSKNKIPLTVHCSLVFTTQREDQEFQKTLALDLYLTELKKEEGARLAYPWKVKNVEYK